MKSEALERNLWLVDAFFAAQNALFWLPVFVLWFSVELPASEVLLLEAVYFFAVVVLEVPSGWLSDRLGRRWTLVLSGLGWAAGAAFIASGVGFAWFALGQVLLASGRAFASGTDSSILFETLHALGRTDEMRARHGRASAFGWAMLAVASLGGGLLGFVDLRLPYLVSIAGGVVASGVALAFVEPPRVGEAATPAEQLDVVRQASRDPVVRRVLVLAVAMIVLVHIPYELQQPWLDRLLEDDRTSAVSGFFVACGFAMAALGSRVSAPLARWLDPDDRGIALTRGIGLGMALLAAVMGLMALGPYVWIAPILAVRSFPTGLTGPLVEAEIHPRLPSSIRATWLSLQSLAGRLAFAGVLVGFSMLVGADWSVPSLQRVLVPSAVLALVGAVLAVSLRPLR